MLELQTQGCRGAKTDGRAGRLRFVVRGLLGMSVVTAVGAAHAAGPPALWRSALYSVDWTPAYQDAQGRFLHDFSYAGYHNGEAPVPQNPPGAVFDVVGDFGADNHGTADATPAIQQAINAATAAGAGVVFLPAGLYRCDGILTVNHSNVVVRGAGEYQTRVYFPSFAGMGGRSHIAFTGPLSQGPHLPLALDGEDRSAIIYLNDASGLNVGDDISIGWVITDDFVAEHGMTGTWQAFNGTWRPVFRRKVVAINAGVTPHEVRIDVPLRYAAKLRDSASVRKETGYIQECGLEMLSLANAVAYDDAWTQIGVHAVHFVNVKDCWMRRVNSFVSPADPAAEYHLQGGGIRITASKRVTVADCRFDKAQNRGDGGCGYLFHTTTSNEVLFRDCIGNAGRHNFIVNWDFGSAGCVFLRCNSFGGRALVHPYDMPIQLGLSEYHHSLAMACLVDQCESDDGWSGGNRELWSSGAGHTVTENAYWNISGTGVLQSWAYGWGYVIGTDQIHVMTGMSAPFPFSLSRVTEPQDYTEGIDLGSALVPQSLYEDQLARRLGTPDTDGDGIKDADEDSGKFGYITEPLNPDTDGDGLSDGDEMRGARGPRTDPTLADSDEDGFTDYDEVMVYHTDPNDSHRTPMCSLSVPWFR